MGQTPSNAPGKFLCYSTGMNTDSNTIADADLLDNPDLAAFLTPRMTKYIPCVPWPKQQAFLLLDNVYEVFFGGSCGGGKSESLLMAALQYVDVPGYSAIILRRTFKDLSEPEAIMDRSLTWLKGTDAKWNDKEKTWRFPSGAKLVFGYMDGPLDHLNYQGAAFQYVGFDEASQLRWNQMQYMHSRIRRTKDIPVPLRIRFASNPGGVSHLELKTRFIDPRTRAPGVVFVPSALSDNPSLNKEEYIKNLQQITDPVTREQLLNGNWDISDGGQLFQRGWFFVVKEAPTGKSVKRVRFWDLAATEKSVGKDPDWTCGALVSIVDGMICVENMVRGRWRPQEVERIIAMTAETDGKKVPIRMEQEPGSSGVTVIDHYSRKVLTGFDFKGIRSTGKKEEYAKPLSAAAEQGNVCLLGPARWHGPFLDEAEGFPFVPHDDQVDSVSKALAFLTGKKKRAGVW